MDYRPEGFPTVIANMTFKDSKKAVAFYEKALGATGVQIMEADTGWVMHGMMWIGDSLIFFNDETEFSPRKAPTGPNSIAFYIYVPDVDASYKMAVAAGMTSNHVPETMFWGDRTAVVTDPFHYTWTFSTQMSQPTPEEIEAGQKAMFGGS